MTLKTTKKTKDILIKVYIPPKKHYFPIMFINSKTKKTLIKEFGEDDFDNLIPDGLQTVNLNSDIDIESLKETLNSENNIVYTIIYRSKLFDLNKDIYEARILLNNIGEYESSVNINDVKNIEDIDKYRELLNNFVLMDEKKKSNDDIDIENFEKSIIDNNDPKLFANPSEPDRINLNYWVLPTRKDFPKFISTNFHQSVDEIKRTPIQYFEKGKVTYSNSLRHQKFVSDYLSENSPYRGLLLYHGLGSGKSGSSIFIAEGFRHRKVCVMLPASLHTNYESEIRKFGEIAYKNEFYWTWVSLPMTTVDTQNKVYEFLNSKGIQRELAEMIITTKTINGKNNYGLFMIDTTQTKPNYNNLSTIDKKLVDNQIEIMLKYKYTIVHYNSSYAIRNIFEAYIPNFNEIKSRLFGTELKKKFSQDDYISIFNYIFKKENKIKNPFDDKLIIVDEVHNLISKMVNSSIYGKMIYELIMRAENLKLVFLSGTPSINYPFEFSVMFNLLRGYIYIYTIRLSKSIGGFKPDEIREVLKTFKFLDRISINVKDNTIKVIRTPYGFINKFNDANRYIGVARSVEGNISNDEFINLLLLTLSSRDYRLDGVIRIEPYSVFPDILGNISNDGTAISKNKVLQEKVESEFEINYVDQTNYSIKKANIFKNNIVGLVSFFNEVAGIDNDTGSDLFPKKFIAPKDDTEVFMSNYQFMDYCYKRNIERELEEKNMKMAQYNQARELSQSVLGNDNSLFRVYSRQRGLFTFPPEIYRPERKKLLVELDAHSTDIIEDECYDDINSCPNEYKSENAKYEDQCKKAINALTKDNLSINIKDYNLTILSPKFAKMLDNINKTHGLVFCYSQFRSVEGIGIFSRVLNNNGYQLLGYDDKNDKSDKYRIGRKVRYDTGNNNWRTGTIRSISGTSVQLAETKESIDINDIYPCYYALWTGTESVEERTMIQNEYTDDGNMYGQKCLILLITASGSEGISLRNVRQVHIMEPYWNNVRVNQVIGRARRIRSHIYLPKDQQNVTIYQYCIRFTPEQISGKWSKDIPEELLANFYKLYERYRDQKKELEDKDNNDSDESNKVNFKKDSENFKAIAYKLSDDIREKDSSMTSDEFLTQVASKKEKILSTFLTAIKETAIDCNFNHDLNIASDPAFKNLRCYNNIDSTDPEYTYNVTSNDIVVNTTNIQTYKLLIDIPVEYSNYGTIMAMTELPTDTFKYGTDEFDDGHPIYDYYLHNGLYYKEPKKLYIVIGHFKNNLPVLKPEFIDTKWNDYALLQNCMKRNGKLPKDELLKDTYVDKIKQCHIEADNYWECIQCFQTIPTDTPKCNVCDITRDTAMLFNNDTRIIPIFKQEQNDIPKPANNEEKPTKTKFTIFKKK